MDNVPNYYKSGGIRIIDLLLESCNASEDILERIVRTAIANKDEEILHKIAIHPNASAKVLKLIIQNCYHD